MGRNRDGGMRAKFGASPCSCCCPSQIQASIVLPHLTICKAERNQNDRLPVVHGQALKVNAVGGQPGEGRRMRPAWVALPALLVVLAAVRPASTQGTQTLECSKSVELTAVGVDWQCENFGSIAARQNTTYLLTVDANAATYQQYDINITLISLTGDADL